MSDSLVSEGAYRHPRGVYFAHEWDAWRKRVVAAQEAVSAANRAAERATEEYDAAMAEYAERLVTRWATYSAGGVLPDVIYARLRQEGHPGQLIADSIWWVWRRLDREFYAIEHITDDQARTGYEQLDQFRTWWSIANRCAEQEGTA